MTYALSPHIAQAVAQSDARIVVTGAGGWLGMATLELLATALGDEFERRVICFGSSERALTLLNGSIAHQRPLSEIVKLGAAPTIVLHLAFLTKDHADAMEDDAYRAGNEALDHLLLDHLDPIGAQSVFVASSGAAYLADDPRASSGMRLYGTLKREQERRFADWAKRRSKRAVITRIFNLSGPHINKQGSYALACFIRDALAGRPIAIHAPHPVIRGYVAIRELMSLVLATLLDGEAGTIRFDSGGDPFEMQAIAEAVAELLGPVPIVRPAVGEGVTADRYAGDGEAYRALLADRSIEPVPFARQIAETAEFLALSLVPSPAHRVATAKQSC